MRTRLLSVGIMVAAATACTTTDRQAAMAPMPPHELAITGADYSFTAPDTTPAGLTHVTFRNDGPNLHHVQFVKLDSGKTLDDLLAAMKQHPGAPPAWAVPVPGPNAPDPGGMSNETVDLAAGNYAIICVVDIPGGVPHVMKGMARALTVSAGEPMTYAQDSADVRVEMADYSFTLSAPLTAGRHVIEVSSKGPQPHELEIVRLAPGKTIDDLGKWMAKPVGPPPGNALGGTSAQLPGTTVQFVAEFTPGKYVMMCVIADAKDGKPHLAHGMMKEFTIE